MSFTRRRGAVEQLAQERQVLRVRPDALASQLAQQRQHLLGRQHHRQPPLHARTTDLRQPGQIATEDVPVEKQQRR
jgi:hypothetical protein